MYAFFPSKFHCQVFKSRPWKKNVIIFLKQIPFLPVRFLYKKIRKTFCGVKYLEDGKNFDIAVFSNNFWTSSKSSVNSILNFLHRRSFSKPKKSNWVSQNSKISFVLECCLVALRSSSFFFNYLRVV